LDSERRGSFSGSALAVALGRRVQLVVVQVAVVLSLVLRRAAAFCS
jgi:hypothetical protein